MGKYKIVAIIGAFLFLIGDGISYSQYSAGGGISSFYGLNLPISRYGINVFYENPRTENNTFLLRAVYMFPDKEERITAVSAKSYNTTPSMTEAIEIAKTSYFAVDWGTRYYMINSYDIGTSLYIGGYFKGILSSYGSKYRLPGNLNPSDYETSTYPPQPLTEVTPQFSLLFSFGGTVGVKHQLPVRGAVTLDVGLELVSRLYDPALILGNEISPISLSVNLAYRFDWY